MQVEDAHELLFHPNPQYVSQCAAFGWVSRLKGLTLNIPRRKF